MGPNNVDKPTLGFDCGLGIGIGIGIRIGDWNWDWENRVSVVVGHTRTD